MNNKCRLDNTELIPVVDMGNLFVSDFVDRVGAGEQFPVMLGRCPACGLTQLADSYSPEKMYRHYWYRSGTNEQMRQDLQDVVESAEKWVTLNPRDYVLDIGANDGTMLSFFPRDVVKVGIDPSQLIVEEAPKNVPEPNVLIRNFFSKYSVPDTEYKVITSIAMFYDIESPLKFTEDIYDILSDDGVWIVQLSYTPLMVKQNAWDNLGHEHIMYYTLSSIIKAIDNRFRLVDVELNNVNCGSFRLYFTKNRPNVPGHELVLGNLRIDSLAAYEMNNQYENGLIYDNYFAGNVKQSREELVQFLSQNAGKVYGLGASTKGNTLLQYCGVTPEIMPAIADRQPQKHGLLTAGTWIPIISEEELRKIKPEYALILPWTFSNNIIAREKELRSTGTKFVVPLPKLHIL